MKNIKDYILSGFLCISIAFFFLYIFFDGFRYYLSCLNVDPNFLVAFVTVITLIVSMIGIRKERKYNFNLDLKNLIQLRVELVVGKLFTIMNDSSNFLETIKNIKSAIDTNKKFIDIDNVLYLDNLKKDKELLGAYVTMYFSQYIQNDWNLMAEKINQIGTNCSKVLNNYNENHELIGTEGFQNEALSNTISS